MRFLHLRIAPDVLELCVCVWVSQDVHSRSTRWRLKIEEYRSERCSRLNASKLSLIAISCTLCRIRRNSLLETFSATCTRWNAVLENFTGSGGIFFCKLHVASRLRREIADAAAQWKYVEKSIKTSLAARATRVSKLITRAVNWHKYLPGARVPQIVHCWACLPLLRQGRISRGILLYLYDWIQKLVNWWQWLCFLLNVLKQDTFAPDLYGEQIWKR